MRGLAVLLRVLAVLGLAYDVYAHLHLASTYDPVGDAITQGMLFRLEAAMALVAGVALVASDRRVVWALAGLIGLGGVFAVLLYRYVDVPAVGPIPSMYEPLWYAEKTWSAVAEAGVALAWGLREAVRQRTPRRQRRVS